MSLCTQMHEGRQVSETVEKKSVHVCVCVSDMSNEASAHAALCEREPQKKDTLLHAVQCVDCT